MHFQCINDSVLKYIRIYVYIYIYMYIYIYLENTAVYLQM